MSKTVGWAGAAYAQHAADASGAQETKGVTKCKPHIPLYQLEVINND